MIFVIANTQVAAAYKLLVHALQGNILHRKCIRKIMPPFLLKHFVTGINDTKINCNHRMTVNSGMFLRETTSKLNVDRTVDITS